MSENKQPAATTPEPARVLAPVDGTVTAGPLPSDAPKAPPKAKVAEPTCPTCGGPLERYRGVAAHKIGSAFCHACGLRHYLGT